MDIDKHLTRKKPMTQHKAILNYLQTGKSLTVATALRELGVYALSQRIGEMKKDYPIADEWVENNGKRFKRYYLQVPNELPFQ